MSFLDNLNKTFIEQGVTSSLEIENFNKLVNETREKRKRARNKKGNEPKPPVLLSQSSPVNGKAVLERLYPVLQDLKEAELNDKTKTKIKIKVGKVHKVIKNKNATKTLLGWLFKKGNEHDLVNFVGDILNGNVSKNIGWARNDFDTSFEEFLGKFLKLVKKYDNAEFLKLVKLDLKNINNSMRKGVFRDVTGDKLKLYGSEDELPIKIVKKEIGTRDKGSSLKVGRREGESNAEFANRIRTIARGKHGDPPSSERPLNPIVKDVLPTEEGKNVKQINRQARSVNANFANKRLDVIKRIGNKIVVRVKGTKNIDGKSVSAFKFATIDISEPYWKGKTVDKSGVLTYLRSLQRYDPIAAKKVFSNNLNDSLNNTKKDVKFISARAFLVDYIGRGKKDADRGHKEPKERLINAYAREDPTDNGKLIGIMNRLKTEDVGKLFKLVPEPKKFEVVQFIYSCVKKFHKHNKAVAAGQTSATKEVSEGIIRLILISEEELEGALKVIKNAFGELREKDYAYARIGLIYQNLAKLLADDPKQLYATLEDSGTLKKYFEERGKEEFESGESRKTIKQNIIKNKKMMLKGDKHNIVSRLIDIMKVFDEIGYSNVVEILNKNGKKLFSAEIKSGFVDKVIKANIGNDSNYDDFEKDANKVPVKRLKNMLKGYQFVLKLIENDGNYQDIVDNEDTINKKEQARSAEAKLIMAVRSSGFWRYDDEGEFGKAMKFLSNPRLHDLTDDQIWAVTKALNIKELSGLRFEESTLALTSLEKLKKELEDFQDLKSSYKKPNKIDKGKTQEEKGLAKKLLKNRDERKNSVRNGVRNNIEMQRNAALARLNALINKNGGFGKFAENNTYTKAIDFLKTNENYGKYYGLKSKDLIDINKLLKFKPEEIMTNEEGWPISIINQKINLFEKLENMVDWKETKVGKKKVTPTKAMVDKKVEKLKFYIRNAGLHGSRLKAAEQLFTKLLNDSDDRMGVGVYSIITQLLDAIYRGKLDKFIKTAFSGSNGLGNHENYEKVINLLSELDRLL